MSLKICFLSYTHPCYDTRILHKEAKSLSEAGFDVVHLCPGGDNNYYQHGVHIVMYSPSTGMLGRFSKLFRLYKLAVETNADCYHCNEVESWIIGSFIKLFHRGKRVIFDVHEHYPSRFREPHFPKWLKWVGEPAIRLLFLILTPWTDHLIFAKRSVAPDFHGDRHKHSFIFNYGLLWLQSGRPKDAIYSVQKEFAGRCIAIHVGGFSRARGWPQLLQSLALMKCQQVEVVCFGNIHEGRKVLLTEAEQLGVADRIHIKERVSYEQMFDYLLCADIGLMLYQPGIMNHVYAFPMKMYDYMLAGLPVIGPDFAIEVEPVVRQEKCGLLVNTAVPGQIAEALDWLCENPNLSREMGQRGCQAVIRQYNWEMEAVKLIKIYSEIGSKGVN